MPSIARLRQILLNLVGNAVKFTRRDGSITVNATPLSKRLAELHGGTLEIASTPGIGTIVEVSFPRQRVGFEQLRAALS